MASQLEMAARMRRLHHFHVSPAKRRKRLNKRLNYIDKCLRKKLRDEMTSSPQKPKISNFENRPEKQANNSKPSQAAEYNVDSKKPMVSRSDLNK
jgi:hypothetical protein